MSAGELKSQLEGIEKELMQLSVKRESVAPCPKLKPPAEQERTASGQGSSEETLMESMIARPAHARSRSRSLVRPRAVPSASSSSSDAMQCREQNRNKRDELLEIRLASERQKLDTEFQLVLDKLRRELDDARRRRACEKEAFRECKDRMEREARDLKLENSSLSGNLRTANQQLQLLQVQNEELSNEVKQANADMSRMEARISGLNQSFEENLSNSKKDKQRLESLLEEKEKEIGRVMRDKSRLERKEEETLTKEVMAAERNNELSKMVQEMQEKYEEQKRMSSCVSNEQREKFESTYEELQLIRQQLENEKMKAKSFGDKAASLYIENRELRNVESELQMRREDLENEKKRLLKNLQGFQQLKIDFVTAVKKQQIGEERLEKLRDQCTQLEKTCTKQQNLINEQKSDLGNLNNTLMIERNRNSVLTTQRSLMQKPSTAPTELLDVEGRPLYRLGHAQTTQTRPSWWDTLAEPIRRPADHNVYERPDFRNSNNGNDYHAPNASSDLHSPTELVPLSDLPCTTSSGDDHIQANSATLLECERNDIKEKLSRFTRSRSFRTTDENEEFDRLTNRLKELNGDLAALRS